MEIWLLKCHGPADPGMSGSLVRTVYTHYEMSHSVGAYLKFLNAVRRRLFFVDIPKKNPQFRHRCVSIK